MRQGLREANDLLFVDQHPLKGAKMVMTIKLAIIWARKHG